MPKNISYEQQVLLNFAFGQITGQKQFAREATRTASEAFASGTKEGMAEGIKKSRASLSKSVASLHEAGMGPAVKGLRAAYQEGTRLQEKQAQELEKIHKQLDQTEDKALKKELRERKRQIKDEIKARQRAQDELLKKSDAQAEAALELRKQHEAKMNQDRIEKMQESGENFQKLVEQAMSLDSLSASNLTESVTKALGGIVQARAGSAAASGQGATALSLARLAGSIGAIAAPLAALVSVISAAVGNATEMNKALLDNASVYDITGESVHKLNIRLSMLRRVALDTATEFRLTREEVMGGITALNQAGLTIKSFRAVAAGAVDDMTAFRDVTRTAVLASQGLGISSSEVGDFMNNTVKELGYNLREIQGAFGIISGEAEKSGMATKDFFAAVTSASSGMALYNFRLDSTVGLFTDLIDILGEDLAKEKIKLEGTFSGMGMQERTKSTLLMGTGRAKQILQADARAQAEEFSRVFGQNIDVEILGRESQKEFETRLNEMTDPAAKRQLIELRRLARGAFNGGLLGAARSLGSVSRNGELALQLSQAASITGGGPMSSMSNMMRMAFEEITGVSGEQFDILERIDMGLRAEFEKLGGAAGLGKSFVEALAAGDLSESMGQQEAIKQYSEMEQVAIDSLKETRSISQTLSNTIAGYLEKIWLGVESIWKYVEGYGFGRGASAGVTAQRNSAQTEVFQGRAEMLYGAEALQRALSSAETNQALLAKLSGSTQNYDRTEGRKILMDAMADPSKQKLLEELLKVEVEKMAVDKRLASDESFREQHTQEILDDGFKGFLASFEAARKADEARYNEGLISALQATGNTREEAARLIGAAISARSQGLTQQRDAKNAIQQALGPNVNPFQAAQFHAAGIGIGITKTNDALYSGGRVYTLNNRDEFYAAKSDGVLAQKGGGGGGPVNIHINGGDEARVYAVVKRVLVDTGYNDVRRYGGG